jgi:predicted RNA-binding Zn-ribbon protein involved in translation (DUF1610 family)
VIEFEVKYEAGHSYKEQWETVRCFCPNCGGSEVWRELGGGDYYVGELHMCWRCGAEFHLPNGANVPHEKNWQAKQRIEAIRASVSRSGSGSAAQSK